MQLEGDGPKGSQAKTKRMFKPHVKLNTSQVRDGRSTNAKTRLFNSVIRDNRSRYREEEDAASAVRLLEEMRKKKKDANLKRTRNR